MKRAGAILVALLTVTRAAGADRAPTTVGTVAQSNGLSRNGYLQVRTPSVLRVEDTAPVQADARAAIEQYDRLLELDADVRTRAEALRRAADLRLQLADTDAIAGGGFHVAEVRRAIADYRRVLSEHPANPDNDRVLYQLARAHQLLDDAEGAIAALLRLGREHPQSLRAGEANFRAGEMLFARGRHDQAAQAYAALLATGTDAPYHDAAQYKYGWALYKQGAYAEAAEVFLAILDRELQAGTPHDPQAALAAVAANRRERASESLRVAALCFAALGGGEALGAYFARAKEAVRLETLMIAALGATLLDKERYTDAAAAYAALVRRHPDHARAPDFSQRQIDALQRGGFGTEALHAREAYVALYAPDAPYWTSRTPDPAITREVRRHLDAIARTHQAAAQANADAEARRAGYRVAAGWYRRSLALFPQEADAQQTHLLLADALLEGGQVGEAAQQYEHTAFALAAHAAAPVAALAAVQAWQRLVREGSDEARDAARRASIAAGLRLAEHFPAHPQRTQVLMAVAEDQVALGDFDAAALSAERVLQAAPAATLRRGALGVIGDARSAQSQHALAEAAYRQLVAQPAADAAVQQQAVEQLASSIYRQAEAARASGDLRLAAAHFERVGRAAPTARIRSSADYDAAAAYLELADWAQATRMLESFGERYPQHRLLPDADKKLALAYENNGQLARAAQVLLRVARRTTEPDAIRRQATLAAAELYDRAQMPGESRQAWLQYVGDWPTPPDPAMRARQRLAELAQAQQDGAAQRHWLEQIVAAAGDRAAGESTRRIVAQATLELGRMDAAAARGLRLEAPLERSVARRRAATERAVAAFERAAAFGYADVTSAATYELAAVYGDLGRALLQSPAPPTLSGEALAQYTLLLEEQAFPFEEKAIHAHEINLARVRHGTWNEAIRRSVTALGELSPGKYGKQERRETSYDELH